MIKKHIRGQSWTKEQVVWAIKERKRRHLPLNSKSIEHDNQSLLRFSSKLFGSWNNALHAAGFNPDKIRRFTWTPEKLITAVKQWVKRHPKKPHPHSETYRKWFSLNSAVKRHFHGAKVKEEKLGIHWPPYRQGFWSPEKVICAIQERVKNGQAISSLKLIKENESLYRAGRYYFGSYRKAVEGSGFKFKEICSPIKSWHYTKLHGKKQTRK
jgi:hypothetical protein